MKQSKDSGLIHISDSGYAFEIGSICSTLYSRRITKEGIAQYDAIGYFTSLEAMFKRLVDMDLEGLRSFQDIVERQISLKTWIKDALVAISQSDSKDFSGWLIPD